MIKIKQGLDLPVNGAPEQKVYEAPNVTEVAVTGFDYNGMKPTMKVQVGEKVKKGQVLFECKKVPGVIYTSPGGGEVKAINRGDRRVFQSIVIALDGSEEEIDFGSQDPASASNEQVREKLVNSGLWTAFRTRPFSKNPETTSSPNSIFITALDTNPLSADFDTILADKMEDFNSGVKALLNIFEGTVYICVATDSNLKFEQTERVRVEGFTGKHPAGLAGTHMHFLDPVSAKKTNWSINAQDVVAIGSLFKTGKLNTDRVVAFSGPQVKNPRLVKTRVGACLKQLTKDQLKDGENRIISGSPYHGRTLAQGLCYLGRFSNQVTVLAEGRERELLGWHMPGFDKFSTKNIFASVFSPGKKFNFTTTTHGSKRAMVPIGMYENVLPLDILPTQLLRALVSGDTDYAQKLGALELDEEDLALCTFVDPGKVDYGPLLRKNLETIEKEG